MKSSESVPSSPLKLQLPMAVTAKLPMTMRSSWRGAKAAIIAKSNSAEAVPAVEKPDLGPKVEFTVTHCLAENVNAWWRAYTDDGTSFDCGDTSKGMRERSQTYIQYETTSNHGIFAWMPIRTETDADAFSPHEMHPIPLLGSNEKLVFSFDDKNQCHPSHMTVFIINRTAHKIEAWVGKDKDKDSSANVVEVPDAELEAIAFRALPADELMLHIQGNQQPTSTIRIRNGATVTVAMENDEFVLSQEPLHCPIPVHDVPIRIRNRSGQQAEISLKGNGYDGTVHLNGIKEDQLHKIIWLSSHPSTIEWKTSSMKKFHVESYKSGMTLTIRRPEALQAAKLLLASVSDYHQAEVTRVMVEANNSNCKLAEQDYLDLLEEAGELERCAPLLAKHMVEYWQLPLLTDTDWERMGVMVGSRLRIQERLRQKGIATVGSSNRLQGKSVNSEIDAGTTDGEYEYDVFLSHRHEGGEDLAQAVKLQLEVMFPRHNLRIFLDLENLQDLSTLENNARRSKHFVLLLTPGALDRPYIQKEVKAALDAERPVVLVHDIQRCPFPDAMELPEDIRPVLEQKVVPYYREHAFREAAMQQIAEALELPTNPK